MKRYRYVSALLFLVILLTAGACKKSFLEVVPKGQNIAVTYEDYDKFMNGSRFYVPDRASRTIWWYAALMGDEVAAESVNFNASGSGRTQARAVFQWQDDIFPLTDPPNDSGASMPDFLTSLLTNLYSLNSIINGVMTAEGGTEQQKKSIQGEAFTERAFIYFQLLNYFTKPYNVATASADPGFPIITEADITATNFQRGNVQACYDFIVNDLTQAIASLSTHQPVRTRVSKAAAEGLLAKVYLFMGKYPEALATLKSAFGDMGLMGEVPELYDYNETLAPGGAFLPVSSINGPNSPFVNITDLKESVWAVFTYAGSYTSNFLTITAKTVGLFDPLDWRLQFYSNLQADLETPIQGGRLRRYNQVYSRIGIQLPDLYLMKAELEARTGDMASAIADVETLRKKRMPLKVASVPVDVAADQNSLIKFIIEERTREFANEGMRWFDMRRLSTDPLFADQPAAQHVVYDDAVTGDTYTLKPERLTLRLPPAYLVQNPGMEDNP